MTLKENGKRKIRFYFSNVFQCSDKSLGKTRKSHIFSMNTNLTNSEYKRLKAEVDFLPLTQKKKQTKWIEVQLSQYAVAGNRFLKKSRNKRVAKISCNKVGFYIIMTGLLAILMIAFDIIMCVWWTFISKHNLWCLSLGVCLPYAFNPGHALQSLRVFSKRSNVVTVRVWIKRFSMWPFK